LNRGVESRSDKHPMLSDLREFGSLEQLAHLVMLLYRDEYYNKESTTKQGITEIIVGKNRNGATGHVEAITDLSKNRYFDIPEGYGNEF
jgi:replicative DNA helicase